MVTDRLVVGEVVDTDAAESCGPALQYRINGADPDTVAPEL
jgi:hypothetical protein